MRDLKCRCEMPEVQHMKGMEANRFVGDDIVRIQSYWVASHVLARGLFFRPDRKIGKAAVSGRFPCPWQELSPAERAYRAKVPSMRDAERSRPFRRGHCGIARWLVEYSETGLRKESPVDPARPAWVPGQSIRCAGAEMGIFEIGWDFFTNEEICQAFAEWVARNRPAERPAPDHRGHRLYDFRVALRRLGIMRLMHRCPLSKMKTWCPAAWERYQRAKWVKERQRAAETFRKLLPFLPTGEKPLSWPSAGSRPSR
jgi:hypothetical protein